MPDTKHIAIALELHHDFDHHQIIYSGILRYAKERGDWQISIDEYPGDRPRGGQASSPPTYDGVIARAWPKLRDRLDPMDVPWVNVLYQARGVCSAGVYTDPEVAGRMAAEHLIERGFHRLVSVYQPGHKHVSAVADAFKCCVAEYGYACEEFHLDEEEEMGQAEWAERKRQIDRLINAIVPPTAFFVELPMVARLVLQHSIERGIHVPLDLAMLCHRDLKPSMEAPPTISALRYDYERIGYEACQLLDQLMSGQAVSIASRMVPPQSLVARESTDYFVTDDPVVSAALRHISSRLTEALYTEDVADAAGVSARSLHDRFKKTLNRSVAQEVRRLRLALAKRLLIEGEHPIQEIAKLSGLGDGKSIVQVFRRELGMTPSGFRSQHG